MQPWEQEPDQLEWEHLGLKCLILRHPTMRHLCGYVRIPMSNPMSNPGEEACWDLDVHGGITWSGSGRPPRGDRSLDYWWLGFDCGHAGDWTPGLKDFIKKLRIPHDGTYRTLDYVKNECERLAEQLAFGVGDG